MPSVTNPIQKMSTGSLSLIHSATELSLTELRCTFNPCNSSHPNLSDTSWCSKSPRACSSAFRCLASAFNRAWLTRRLWPHRRTSSTIQVCFRVLVGTSRHPLVAHEGIPLVNGLLKHFSLLFGLSDSKPGKETRKPINSSILAPLVLRSKHPYETNCRLGAVQMHVHAAFFLRPSLFEVSLDSLMFKINASQRQISTLQSSIETSSCPPQRRDWKWTVQL